MTTIAADVVSIAGWRGTYGEPRRTKRKTDAERAADLKRALEIRRHSGTLKGTPGETYFRSRGLLPDVLLYGSTGWPPSIRWTDDAMRKPTPPVKPGIVIDVTNPTTGAVTGIHRIIFKRDGTVEKEADGRKVKIGLGVIWGSAATLDCEPDPQGRWGVAEGPETAMAARQLYRMPIWCACFGSNMAAIRPPRWARQITIFADNDPVNTKLGYSPGAKYARDAMAAYRRCAWVDEVCILAPECVKDFADVLQGIAYA
jgi:putative DNA primase/helicase